MSVDWFEWYCQQAAKSKPWAKCRDRYLCPCCYMPTLDERAEYDICPICFWEDDGQDTDDASETRGGPNHDYSLQEARANFRQHHTMYRESDSVAFARERGRIEIKQGIYSAFSAAITTGSDDDWDRALDLLASYHNELD